MGYYSKVGIALPEDKYQEMLKEITNMSIKKPGMTLEDLTKAQKDANEIVEMITYADTNKIINKAAYSDDEFHKYHILIWNSVKWYSDYPVVMFFENFLGRKYIQDNYEYIIIGEEVDDVCIEKHHHNDNIYCDIFLYHRDFNIDED